MGSHCTRRRWSQRGIASGWRICAGIRVGRRWRSRGRCSWAELLARVFAIDVWLCPQCGGRRRLLTAIQDPAAIRQVLAAMGLSAAVPDLAAERSPPRED